MTTPTLRAIKCSERMPTREDADENGHVKWLRYGMSTFGRFDNDVFRELSIEWFPLNRYAIATDAEEQRGEGGE